MILQKNTNKNFFIHKKDIKEIKGRKQYRNQKQFLEAYIMIAKIKTTKMITKITFSTEL